MHTLGRGLRKRGMDVHVITLNAHGNILNSLLSFEIIDDIPVHRVKVRSFLYKQIDVGLDKKTLYELLNEFDIIHVFSSIPSELLYRSIINFSSIRPVIWQPIFIPHRFAIQGNYWMRLLGELHDNLVLPKLARRVRGILALTKTEGDFFRRHTRKKCLIRVIGECVEEIKIPPVIVNRVLDKYKLKREGFVLSVGRIVWYKGYDLLIDAWHYVERKWPSIKLVIVGKDYGFKDFLERKVRSYKLKNVIFTGAISSEELHALYDACLFVISLSRFETFHRIALEAWSHRKAIVALNLGAATEHIKPGTGILVPDNPLYVARIIHYLLQHPEVCQEMGDQGYRVYRNNYSVNTYVTKVIKTYKYIYNLT